jgi:hypothetical protein
VPTMDEERQGEAAGGVGPTVARWARAAAAMADGEFMLGHALTCRIRQERARERTGAK